MSMHVVLQDVSHLAENPTLAQFQLWVDTALDYIPEPIPETVNEVTIRLIDQSESTYLNENFRKKTGPTNVLSFPAENLPNMPQESLGDLAICAELVQQEAKQLNCSTTAHWAHLTVHGILHLLHYDHVDDAEAASMEALEIAILAKLGFPNPYQSPSIA